MSGSTFNREAFEEKVRGIGDLLGELWAIDAVLDYVEDNPRHVNPDGGFVPAYDRVTIGDTSPFEIEAPDNLWHLAVTAGRNWGNQVAESIRSLSWDVVRPESSTFEEAVAVIRSEVVDTIRTGVADDFARLDNNLSSWNGAAADAFGDWYAQLEIIARRQAYVAETVCAGIAACKAVVDVGQQSLMNLVDAVDELIREQLSLRAQHHALPPEPSYTQALLIVGAGLLGALAAIPTGGASAITTGVVLASLAASTSEVLQLAAASIPADGGVETEFSAKTSEEFFHELSGRLAEILDNVRSQWRGVEGVIEDLYNDASSAEQQGLLAPKRPSIVRTVTPDGFHHETAPR
jgi:uncharacterized protein YukE